MSYPSATMQLNFLDDGRIEPPPTTTTTSTAAAVTSRNSDPAPDHGRGTRPIRRRSRASRRTPTTLLNTDTTNFRAMVQRFTGSPAAATSHLANAAGSLDFTQHIAGHVPPYLYPVQYPNQMQQRHMFLVDDHTHGHRGGGGGGVFPHAPLGSSSSNENRDYNNFML